MNLDDIQSLEACGGDLDCLMRWMFYLDTGRTIEEEHESIMDSIQPGRHAVCDLSTSLFEKTARELLEDFKEDIIASGNKWNVDARAIAGAITWEYEQNLKGRFSDYVQYWRNPFTPSGATIGGNGLGWGSIHTTSLQPFYPDATEAELACMRFQAESAINLVGQFMHTMADIYFKESGGIWVNNKPEVLALFYRAGIENGFVSNAAKKRKINCLAYKEKIAKEKEKVCLVNGGKILLTTSIDPMASWIAENNNELQLFKTEPTPPSGCYVEVEVE